MNEIYHHALKLLRRKDYTQKQLREKLEEKFGAVPDDITSQLLAKRYLNDQRYADNFAARHSDCHPDWVREALQEAGAQSERAMMSAAARWPSWFQWLNPGCRLSKP